MKLEIDEAHGKALKQIQEISYGYGCPNETIEKLIDEFLLHERGRLGYIQNGVYEESG